MRSEARGISKRSGLRTGVARGRFLVESGVVRMEVAHNRESVACTGEDFEKGGSGGT